MSNNEYPKKYIIRVATTHGIFESGTMTFEDERSEVEIASNVRDFRNMECLAFPTKDARDMEWSTYINPQHVIAVHILIL